MCVHATLATPGSGIFSASLMKAKLVNPDNMGTGSMSVSSRKEHGLSEQEYARLRHISEASVKGFC